MALPTIAFFSSSEISEDSEDSENSEELRKKAFCKQPVSRFYGSKMGFCDFFLKKNSIFLKIFLLD